VCLKGRIASHVCVRFRPQNGFGRKKKHQRIVYIHHAHQESPTQTHVTLTRGDKPKAAHKKFLFWRSARCFLASPFIFIELNLFQSIDQQTHNFLPASCWIFPLSNKLTDDLYSLVFLFLRQFSSGINRNVCCKNDNY
jgi:hypothetical protein